MTYAGNRIFNINTAIGLTPIILAIIFWVNDNSYLILITPFLYLIIAGEAFYFEITADKFIVKNYMAPFFKTQYLLDEITEVQLLKRNSRSIAEARLKIIRGDKQSIGYNGASLRIKDFQAMIDDLTNRKIPVGFDSDELAEKIGLPE